MYVFLTLYINYQALVLLATASPRVQNDCYCLNVKPRHGTPLNSITTDGLFGTELDLVSSRG